MTSPTELVADLADVVELVDAQVDAGLNRDEVMQSLFNSWSQRLTCASKLSPKGKALVTNAISKGPWSESQRADLASILLGGDKQSTKAVARRSTQKMQNPENFIKMTTFIKLKSKISRSSRMSMLAADMRAVGLQNPDQPTLYKLVAIVAYCEDNHDMTQDEVWSCMDDIQTYIKSVPRCNALPYDTHYPVSADLLHDVVKQNAYGNDAPPAALDIPELAAVLGSAKMRGRPVGVKKNKMPAWLAHIPQEHRAAVIAVLKPSSSSGSLSSVSSPTSPTASAPTSAHAASDAVHTQQSPNVAFTADSFRFQAPPPMSKSTGATQHNMKKAVDADDVDDDDADEKTDEFTDDELEPNTIADLETSLLNARKAMRAMKTIKRPAAAASIMKRPATSGSIMKRPAASNAIKPKAKQTQPHKKPAATRSKAFDIKTAAWKNVHSKIYHKIRQAVLDKTGDDAKAKAAASEACARAKVKFSNGTLKL